MALLYRKEYKQRIRENLDYINEVLSKNYSFTIYITIDESGDFLLTKTWSDGILYTYDEVEESLQFIDNYLKKHINFFLFTEKRQAYLLDTIKRIWDVDKSENILKETISKGYIN